MMRSTWIAAMTLAGVFAMGAGCRWEIVDPTTPDPAGPTPSPGGRMTPEYGAPATGAPSGPTHRTPDPAATRPATTN